MYEELMNKSDIALQKAIEFYQKDEIELATFWKYASNGFKLKALNLII